MSDLSVSPTAHKLLSGYIASGLQMRRDFTTDNIAPALPVTGRDTWYPVRAAKSYETLQDVRPVSVPEVSPVASLPTVDHERKALPAWSFLVNYFPDSFLEVVRVAVAGNRQHNPGEELHWSRGKSMDQMNTAFRHMWDHARGNAKDTDGCYHLAKAIWRLSAELQLQIEKDEETQRASNNQ